MTEIIKKLTKEFEESGYTVAKNTFDGWLSSKKDITQKDEAIVKLFMARLCLAQDKLDDLQEFFNTGMSQAEKEEIESLKSKVQELEKLIVQKDYELESLRKEFNRLKILLSNNEIVDFKSDSRFFCADGYAILKKGVGPFSSYNKIAEVLKKYGKNWFLLSEAEMSKYKDKIILEDRVGYHDCFVRDGKRYGLSKLNGGWNVYIHPVHKIE